MNRAKQNKHYKMLLTFLLLTLAIILAACNTTQPPPNNKAAELTVEDVSSTEVWLNVKTQNVTTPAELKLFRQDSVAQIINLSNSDTLLYEQGLQPNQTYNYHTTIQSSSQTELTVSKTVTATTMDTTSHNFTWQAFTFGGSGGSSSLNDVAIISENDIWCVGEINIADTSQNGYTAYNAVHWDGNSWELKRILVNFRGNMTFIPLEGIYAFKSNDIWLVGSLPIHGDGNNWKIYDVREITNSNLSLSKAWGTSSNDIYFVGRSGSIVHYNGTSWTKIASGTISNIQSIWGIKNINGSYTKYFAADNSMLILDSNNNITKINVEQNMILLSLWGKINNLIYTAGNGVVLYKNKKWERINNNYVDKIYKIKGQDYNDIYGIASGNVILYYNGYNWKNINTNTDNKFWNLSVGSNVIVAVGYFSEKAVITVLKK